MVRRAHITFSLNSTENVPSVSVPPGCGNFEPPSGDDAQDMKGEILYD